MGRKASRWQDFEPQADLRMPPGLHKRLKLYADLSVPRPIVDELRAGGVSIRSAASARKPWRVDGAIHGEAKRSKSILITMDRDFWNDRAFPLHQSAGIVFVDIPPSDLEGIVEGLALFYTQFGKYFPKDWWDGVKVRVLKKSFVIKLRNWDGQIAEEEFALSPRGGLRMRSLR